MGTTHCTNDTSKGIAFRLIPRRPTPEARHQLSQKVLSRLREYATAVTTEFPELNNRVLAAETVKVWRKLLLPTNARSGRPRSRLVDHACDLLQSGVPWSQVPWQVVPGFAQMSSRDQSDAREHLRRAIYMRRRRTLVTNRKHAS